MDIINNLKNIFEQKGIFIPDNEFGEELLLDSLQFISIIIAIEEFFCIEISDEYFSKNLLNSFNDYIKIVDNLLSQ